jgi:hypothetical protein
MHGFSDGALLMLLGGVLGYTIGVCTCVSLYLVRSHYWRRRAEHYRRARDEARVQCILLRRQAG